MSRNCSLAFLLLLSLSLLQGCLGGRDIEPGTSNNTEIIVLESEGIIRQKQCQERGLVDTMLVLESRDCPACGEAKPILKEVEEEHGVAFEYIDLADEGVLAMEGYGVYAMYTPTVIINCRILIGVHSKEDYSAALEEDVS
ncbi:MAG: thioredoxin family protein [Candidatus Micrarchaeota archaeon]